MQLDPSLKQAFSNEFKGILFEFLVAQDIALKCGASHRFYNSVPNGLMQQMSDYEAMLRRIDPDLLTSLPLMSAQMSQQIRDYLGNDFTSVELLGKTSGGKESFKESDICLIKNKEKTLISLKLCGKNAYINTKSAGIKSFFTKYFSTFKNSNSLQSKLNERVDFAFDDLMSRLYEMQDLCYQGRYDNQWLDAGQSELPGKLVGEQRKVLESYYKSLIVIIKDVFEQFFQDDRENFAKCLYPICGLGRDDIHQFMGLHTSHKIDTFSVHYFNLDMLKDALKKLSFDNDSASNTSFSLNLDRMKLQIRVKPMNRFTTPSVKINCSVKYL